MNRTLSLLLALALLSGLLAACGTSPEPSAALTPDPAAVPVTPDPAASPVTPVQPSESAESPEDGPTVTALAEAAFSAAGCEDQPAVERLNAGEDAESLAFYVENAYGLAAEDWEDAAIIRATGASAFEIAVLRCAGEDAAVRAATQLETYIFTRQGDFTGYAPDQADMVAGGGLHQRGPFAALFICPEPDLADAAFTAALDGADPASLSTSDPASQSTSDPASPSTSDPAPIPSSYDPGAVPISPSPSESPVQEDPEFPGRYLFDPPGEDDMSLYDTTAIRTAWAAGDPSGLSDYDRAIYDAARAVLDETLQEGMSDYEKERALYQWIVQRVNYDWTHNNVMIPTPRESFTPYGGLVKQFAVCLGYATSFQLLMDLAGVECITVVGAASYNTGDHAWNMVRLDGNWYCVDATWDANARENGVNLGRPQDWDYFNVTSDIMAETNHQWDYANTPEAVTEGNGN